MPCHRHTQSLGIYIWVKSLVSPENIPSSNSIEREIPSIDIVDELRYWEKCILMNNCEGYLDIWVRADGQYIRNGL